MSAGIQEHGQTYSGIAFMSLGGLGTAAAPAEVTEGRAVRASFDLRGRLRTTADGSSTGSAVPSSGAGVYPLANAQDTVVLVTSATLAASGAWTGSSVVNVQGYRQIAIDTYYTTDSTGGTGGFALWYPRLSNKAGAAPVFGDDVWVSVVRENDTRTVTTPGGTIATGEDSTFSPGFAYWIDERIAFRSLAALTDNDIFRQRRVLDVSHAKWFTMAYAEAGDTANPGTFAVEYSLAI